MQELILEPEAHLIVNHVSGYTVYELASVAEVKDKSIKLHDPISVTWICYCLHHVIKEL